jgi:CRISPR-associated protein Cas1
MTTLFVDRNDADLDMDGDTLVVRVDGERKGTTPMRLLERVVVHGPARMTSRLLARLAELGVGVLVEKSRYRGGGVHVVGEAAGDRRLRLAQYQVLTDTAARARLACPIVEARLAGAKATLEALPTAIGPVARHALERIADAIAQLRESPPLARLRGLEGTAAAAFFEAYKEAFAPALGFVSRNRRPPRDPVNVCLSIGYTLAHHDAVRAAAHEGMDPMLGVYHDLLPGRESLACDLVEPVRAAVEAHVAAVFAQGDLRADSFSFAADGACMLGKTGRRDFYGRFEEEAAPIIRHRLKEEAAALARGLLTEFNASSAAVVLRNGDAASDA